MAMTREEFRKAFRQVVSEEFSDIPKDEASIPITFSRRFEKRMEKLIRNERKPYWFLINTASKRAAIIIAVFLMLFTASFGIKAIRDPIVKFIKEIYNTFIAYSVEGDVAEKIEKRYYLNYLPEGFELTDEFIDENSVCVKYINSFGEVIRFTQSMTEGTNFSLDNENGAVTSETVSGIEINFYNDGENRIAFWSHDRYFFDISTNSNMDNETLKKLVLSVE